MKFIRKATIDEVSAAIGPWPRNPDAPLLPPRPCRACQKHFQPEEAYWDLCDPCFATFHAQKLNGRIAYCLGTPVKYFEGVSEWLEAGRTV